MPNDLQKAYLQISDSLAVAVRELELKASILKRIQTSLYHQASESVNPDLIHSINPENLFDTIKNAIKEYENFK